MYIVEIIERKKHHHELTNDEIKFVVEGFTSKRIPDYQMSAFLMAVWFNGLSAKETAALTKAMMESGDVLDLSSLGLVVDKHSTGGVGDKVTIVLTPILAALGATVVKMSGRGLGFTGGTIDKFETIPGIKLTLTEAEMLKQAKAIKLVQVQQSEHFVPADKMIYALRDVSATVDSMPLVASSIMSKKLATGASAILLDVKCGSGAFMKDLPAAKLLGQTMINLGKALNRDVRVEITSMDEPLGLAIGNKNELLEGVAALQGCAPDDLMNVVYSSATTMLVQAKLFKTEAAALQAVKDVIASGKALKKLEAFVLAQHGDFKAVLKPGFWKPKYHYDVVAKTSGYLEIFNAAQFGEVAVNLGAGRRQKGQPIDNEAGINLVRKTGDKVTKGEVLFKFYSSSPIAPERELELNSAYRIKREKVVRPKLILARMK